MARRMARKRSSFCSCTRPKAAFISVDFMLYPITPYRNLPSYGMPSTDEPKRSTRSSELLPMRPQSRYMRHLSRKALSLAMIMPPPPPAVIMWLA